LFLVPVLLFLFGSVRQTKLAIRQFFGARKYSVSYRILICGHITISMSCGNAAYCVKLSGKDFSRYSNKVESVGLRNVRIIAILLRK